MANSRMDYLSPLLLRFPFFLIQLLFFLDIFTLTRAIADDSNDIFANSTCTDLLHPGERFPEKIAPKTLA